MTMLQLTEAMGDAQRTNLLKRAHTRGVRDGDIGMVGRFFKAATVIAENGGYELEAIVTTDDVDCDQEVVLPDGIDWSVMDTYKTIYTDHFYGVQSVVGKMRSKARVKMPNGWKMRIRLHPDEYSDDVRRVRMLAESETLGASIGFRAIERGTPTLEEARKYPLARAIIRRSQVFEVSLTPMPCNLACRVGPAFVDAEKAAEVIELCRKGQLPGEYSSVFRATQAPKKKTVIFVA